MEKETLNNWMALALAIVSSGVKSNDTEFLDSKWKDYLLSTAQSYLSENDYKLSLKLLYDCDRGRKRA